MFFSSIVKITFSIRGHGRQREHKYAFGANVKYSFEYHKFTQQNAHIHCAINHKTRQKELDMINTQIIQIAQRQKDNPTQQCISVLRFLHFFKYCLCNPMVVAQIDRVNTVKQIVAVVVLTAYFKSDIVNQR